MVDQTRMKLQEIASILAALSNSAADPHELAEVAYLEIARLTEPDLFEIGLFEAESYRTLIRVIDGTRQENLQVDFNADQVDILEWVRGIGEAQLITNYEDQKGSIPVSTTLTVDTMPASALFVPLRFGDRVLGTMSLHSNDADAFDKDDLELLTILSANIAPALATSGLADEVEFLTIQMLLIQQVSRLLLTLEPLPDRMTRIVSLLAQVLEIGEISLYELSDDEIILRAQYGGDEFQNELQEIPTIVAEAISSGEVQSISYPDEAASEEDQSSLQSHFAFPLNIVHHQLGALHLCCPKSKAFLDEELRVLETIAQQLAFAILEARNYAQHQQEAWVTTVLLEVARHAAQPGDPLAALQAVLQLATLLVGTDWIVLMTHEASTGMLKFATSAGLKRQQSFELADVPIELSALGLAAPHQENDIPAVVPIPDPLVEILRDDQALCLVLSDGNDLLGVLLTENEHLSGKQPSLMAGIAHQISLRLENSRLIEIAAAQRSIERELAMARDIQTSFLPSSVPQVSGWEIGIAWRVAREVGGDFYDFITLPPGDHGDRYGIAIADVADKGIPAALYMALSRTLLRTLAMEVIDPGACLERVNKQLIHDTQADLFVSVFYAVWEPEIGRLRYANAGHNPPFLFTPRQRGELLHEHGMVLGVQSTCTYQTRELQIDQDQLLVLYTDGITDAMDSNEDFFSIQRLESLVLGLNDWQAQHVADSIEQRVLQFTGHRELFDDITAIILHR